MTLTIQAHWAPAAIQATALGSSLLKLGLGGGGDDSVQDKAAL